MPFPGAKDLAEVEAALDWTDKTEIEAQLAGAREASVRLEEAQRRKTDTQSRQTTLQAERASLEPKPEDASTRNALVELDQHLAIASEDLSAAKAASAAARATIEATDRALAEAHKRKDDQARALAERDVAAAELADWRLLERSIVGVRDLELDALAPSIAEIATRLLQSADDEGRIRIDTTRVSSGSAKKAKQIEDFLIYYVDASGEEQDIATCSGGEMVWQRKALYDAFAVLRAKNAGIRYDTALLDETDGALNPERREDYFRMLEEAHRASDRYQTILITQSKELAAMASSTIDVTALGPQEEKNRGSLSR